MKTEQPTSARKMLNEFLARQAILTVMQRYAQAIDLRAFQNLSDLFCSEFELDLSVWSGQPARLVERRDYIAGLASRIAGFDATQHLIADGGIFIDGEAAKATINVIASHRLGGLGEAGQVHIVGGYYSDRFVRSLEGWRIAAHKFTPVWELGDRSLHSLAVERVMCIS